MAAVRWTLGAREDLREIVEYIGQDSTAYAAAMAGRLIAAAERLAHHPRLGRVVPEYENETIRELIVGSYRLVYRVRGRRVGIVAVVRASRDLIRKTAAEPWDFA